MRRRGPCGGRSAAHGHGAGAEPRRRHGRLAGRALTVCARAPQALWARSPHGQRRASRECEGAAVRRYAPRPNIIGGSPSVEAAAARSGAETKTEGAHRHAPRGSFRGAGRAARAPRRMSGLSMALYGLCFPERWRFALAADAWPRMRAGPCEQGAKVRRLTEPTLRGAAASRVLRWGCWRWRFCRGVGCGCARRRVLTQIWDVLSGAGGSPRGLRVPLRVGVRCDGGHNLEESAAFEDFGELAACDREVRGDGVRGPAHERGGFLLALAVAVDDGEELLLLGGEQREG